MKMILRVALLLVLTSPVLAQKSTMSLHLTTGTTYAHNSSANMVIVQSVGENDMKITMKVNGRLTYKVTGFKDNKYLLDVAYTSVSMKMEMPQGAMEFTSEKPDDTNPVSKMMSLLINQPFQVLVTTTGKVMEVKGFENFMNSAMDKFADLGPEQKEQIRKTVADAYGDKAFRSSFETSTAVFPDKPVTKGESWTISTKLESGMSIKVETVYTLKDVTAAEYVLEGKSTLSSADKDTYIESNGLPIRYDLSGTMESQIKLEKSSGWINEAAATQKISGTAYIKDNPKIPGGMTLPMSISTTSLTTAK